MEKAALLNQRYQLLRRLLGQGTYATTYAALDHQTNTDCVVKEMNLKEVKDHQIVGQFEREARALAALDHPFIPNFIDSFTVENETEIKFYFVQEFISGRNLAQTVEAGRHFTPGEVIHIGLQMCEILDYLHTRSPPFIHRDIKPSNIMLGSDNQIYLVDFGAVHDQASSDRGITDRKSVVIGTYGYMPFEQFEGRAVLASDIYALGATFIYLLSHKHPIEMQGDALELKFRPHVHCDENMASVLERMVQPHWENRYQNVPELKKDL